VTRHAMLNMAFFGNPPNYWNEKDHKKEEMLAAFGPYTMPIISRLTLIFAKPTLSDGADASDKIKQKILQNMDKTVAKGTNKEEIANLRAFFREYLKRVSRYQPKLDKYKAILGSEFKDIEALEQFKDAFAKRGKTDYRKWAELLNLVKGFARLNGRKKLVMDDVNYAITLFKDSLETLTSAFPRNAFRQGINYEAIELHRQILEKFGNGSGGASGKRSEIARFASKQGRKKDWDLLCKINVIIGSHPQLLVQEIDGILVIGAKWDGDEE